MLVSQPYIIINRHISNGIQQRTITEEKLILYETKIVSATDHFQLSEVTDISYRLMSSSQGFLYLHTFRGVYSFHIKTNPTKFIQIYQQLKSK